jgi:cysteine desulfurase
MKNDQPLYLDYAATAPLKTGALERMMPFMSAPANAHARHHLYGANAARALESARGAVASKIGAPPAQIIFTSGATEANNLAIKGLADTLKARGKNHIITSMVEHKAVLETMKYMQTQGFEVTYLRPKSCAMIEADFVAAALTPQTGLVSIQAVNNELGTIQPLAEIAEILKGRDILFHSDAAQALGKMTLDVGAMGVDLMSLSSHKIGGPQGVGALYAKDAKLLAPQMHGGGQEAGLRSGTVPTFLCVGFGAACEMIIDHRATFQAMRADFLKRLEPLAPIVYGHRDPEWNVPNILNLRFEGIENDMLVMALPALAFGTGSACSAGGSALSHVIETIESAQAATETIRLSWGDNINVTDLNAAANMIFATVTEIYQSMGIERKRA